MNREILRLAIPNIISNITVPLLGMVDIAIAGHLESSLYIGAIALGTTVFNMLYWNFNFLRMGTSGFTAQAYGAGDVREMSNLLVRSLLVALLIGGVIVSFQQPIFWLLKTWVKTDASTLLYVEQYYRIAVWAAPATLAMYAFNGWFIGMQDAKTPMYIAIVNNVLNILLSYTFVFYVGMQIEGIAWGTMLSQLMALLFFVLMWQRLYGGEMNRYISWGAICQWRALRRFFGVNADIFLRTLLLVVVTSFFTFASSSMGADVLAVNALLMQFFMLFSYFMDGFAYAGEALTGKYIGRKDGTKLRKMIRFLFVWGGGIALFSTLVYLFFSSQILTLLTDKAQIVALAQQYTFWVVLIPLAGFSSFIWDGIYVGATASRGMRNSMLVAVALFFLVYYLTLPYLHNMALWLSFLLYLFGRGAMQTIWAGSVIRQSTKH